MRKILLASSLLAGAFGIASCAENAAPTEVTPEVVDAPGPPAVVPAEPECPPDGFCSLVLPAGTPLTLNGIWGSGASDVWILGSPSMAIHWDGTRLDHVRVEERRSLLGVWGSAKGDVWTFGTSQAMWHTRGVDGALEWTASSGKTGANENGYPTPILAMWGSSAQDVWAVGASIQASDGLSVIPSVFHCDGWRDGEPNWVVSKTSEATPPVVESITFNAICGNASTGVWIFGEGGKTRYTSGWQDDATVWTPINSNSSRTLFSAWCSPGGEVWAAGEGGMMHRFAPGDGGGYVEETLATPTIAPLRAMWGASADDIWAVGDNATVIHWDGTAWTPVGSDVLGGTTSDLFAVWGSGEGDVWIAGRDVLLVKGVAVTTRKIQ